jgi:hypothetical protein
MIVTNKVVCTVLVLLTGALSGVCADIDPILKAYRLEIMMMIYSVWTVWLTLLSLHGSDSGFFKKLIIYIPSTGLLSHAVVYAFVNLTQLKSGASDSDWLVILSIVIPWFCVWVIEAKSNTLRNKILDLLSQVTLWLLNKASDSIKSKFGGGDA